MLRPGFLLQHQETARKSEAGVAGIADFNGFKSRRQHCGLRKPGQFCSFLEAEYWLRCGNDRLSRKPSELAFDQSGQFLATGGSDQITVWNFHGDGPEGTYPSKLLLHPESITSLAFSNQGKVLASGSKDGSVFVWLLDQHGDGSPLGGAFVDERISGLQWHPSDSSLAAIDVNGGFHVWKFKVR